MIYAVSFYWLVSGIAYFMVRDDQWTPAHFFGCLIIGGVLTPARILANLAG